MESKQPVAMVTGASSGIGRATALALAAKGYHVFGTTRGKDLKNLGDVSTVTCDVTSDESVADAVSRITKAAGRIDLLVNNAGIGMLGALEDSSIGQHQDLFEVNVFGALRMMKAVLPGMRELKEGRIINISSVLGFIPAPFSASYAASKHALEAYSASLDHEVRGSGVRVILIEPAYTQTSFDKNMLRPDEPKEQFAQARANAESLIGDVFEKADSPEIVARVVVKAAIAPFPRLRYPAGGVARKLNVARKLLPEAVLDRFLRKQMRLDVGGRE